MKKSLLCGGFAALFIMAAPVAAAPPFAELDSNRDKLISPGEAEAWRPLTRVFEALDKNCDGKLQEIEYGYLLTGRKAPDACLGPRKKSNRTAG